MAIAPVPEPLHVITCIFNTQRYESRYRLYKQFAAYMEANPAVILYTVEVAFGDRAFEVTDPHNPRHIRLRTYSEFFCKENAINIGVSRLPFDWKYVAWIDADIEFTRKDWAEETLHQLQHYDVVQMFRDAIDLGPKNEILHTHQGFVYAMLKDGPEKFWNQLFVPYYGRNGSYAHPGYSYGITKDAFNTIGGLLDFSVIGSGDSAMICGCYGQILRAFDPKTLSASMKRKLLIWQDRALKLKQNIGYVSTSMYHYFGGKKVDRNYWPRNSILASFDPDRDLKRDSQMLYSLNDENVPLRDGLRKYFQLRNEDSIDA